MRCRRAMRIMRAMRSMRIMRGVSRMKIMRSMSMVLCLRQEVSTNRFIRCCHLDTLGPCHLVIIMRIQRAWRSTRRMRDMSSMIVWEARGLELFQVHKDNQGNEADFQALTAALHVIVFVCMLLCTLMLINSSIRGHSRPFSQTLTAALHVIVFICCIFTHHFSRRSMRLFRKHWQQHCKWLYLSGCCSVPWRSSHQAYAVTLDLSRNLWPYIHRQWIYPSNAVVCFRYASLRNREVLFVCSVTLMMAHTLLVWVSYVPSRNLNCRHDIWQFTVVFIPFKVQEGFPHSSNLVVLGCMLASRVDMWLPSEVHHCCVYPYMIKLWWYRDETCIYGMRACQTFPMSSVVAAADSWCMFNDVTSDRHSQLLDWNRHGKPVPICDKLYRNEDGERATSSCGRSLLH